MNLRKEDFCFILLLFTSVILVSKGEEEFSSGGNGKVEYEATGFQQVCVTGNTLLMQGSVLNLSKRNRNCSNLNPNHLYLFASKKVYIDDDLEENLNLFIIAPTWEVFGKRKFILDARNGKTYSSKAGNGHQQNNKHGTDGKPGEDAEEAGNFLGIGKTFINGKNLFISANGGNGGDGQNGGDGADGLNGHTYNSSEGLDGLESRFYRYENLEDSWFFQLVSSTVRYIIHGLHGTSGGRGGNGGDAGKGSEKGCIKIIPLDDSSVSFVIATPSDGMDGAPGNGGSGGKGGANGRTVKMTRYSNLWKPASYSVEERDNGSAENGHDGKNGTYEKGDQSPRNKYSGYDFSSALNSFTIYAIRELEKCIKNDSFKDFYYLFDSNEDIVKLYDIFGLIDLFTRIEYHFYEYRNQDNQTNVLLPYYESLKRKIEYQLENEESGKLMISQKILQVVSDKISSMKTKELGTVEDLQKEAKKFKNMVDNFEQYSKDTVKWSFIEKMVSDTFMQMKSCPQKNPHGTSILRDKYDSELENWLMTSSEDPHLSLPTILRRRAESELVYFIEIQLELFCSILSLATVSSTLGKTARQTSVLKNSGLMGTITPKDIQKIYHNANKRYKDYINSRLAILESHLQIVKSRETGLKHESAIEILNNVSKVLKSLMHDLSLYWWRQDPFVEEEKMLREQRKRLRKEVGSRYDFRVVSQVLQKLMILSRLAQVTGSSYKNFVSDEIKMRTMEDHLLADDLEDIQRKVEKIHEIMYPIMFEHRVDINSTGDELFSLPHLIANLSEFRFDNLRNELDDTIFEDSLSSSGEKLTKIFLHPERILEDLRHLFSVIELESKLPDSGVDTKENYFLRYNIALLKYLEQSNLVAGFYGKMKVAYMQYSFPYRTVFIREELDARKLSDLMSFLVSSSDLGDLPFNSFEDLKDDLSKYATLYTLENDTHHEKISDLLSGKPVEFYMMQDNTSRIVKLGSVGIQFASENKTLQEKLEEQLKNFHVSLIHHGDSHYRCCKDEFLIRSGKTEFHQKFNQDLKEPSNFGYLLSPYATWTIQIHNEGDDFHGLKKFEDLFDLRLIGEGRFLNTTSDLCDTSVQYQYVSYLI